MESKLQISFWKNDLEPLIEDYLIRDKPLRKIDYDITYNWFNEAAGLRCEIILTLRDGINPKCLI